MSAPVRTVFLGSGGFAVPVAERLAGLPAVDLVAAVTAPPRPAGRGQHERRSPVHDWAAAAGVPVLAPRRLRAPESIAPIQALRPDLLVLADYGQIVPPELLELPRHGPLNLHPSLLPRHRGAAPIPAAIMAGDEETGVSLMRMDAGLDTGPVIARVRTAIGADEAAPALEARLATLAADLLEGALPAWLAGELPAVPQPAAGATLTRPLRRDDGRLDPSWPAIELQLQVRAYQPWPGSFIETPVGRLIVWAASLDPGEDEEGAAGASVGTLVSTRDRALALVTADGLLRLEEVQPAGGRRMSGTELLRGRPSLGRMS